MSGGSGLLISPTLIIKIILLLVKHPVVSGVLELLVLTEIV